ncbi:MAG: DNA polymerase, partial [Candidatus Buchananbacteria bacterium]
MAAKKQKLLIIDSNALVHRAFHALPPTLTDGQGRPTNAVYGFTSIFLKAIKDIKPDYIAATFDRREKTFRHEQYEAYKATRVKAPDELYEQIPLVKQVLESFSVPIFELAGYEADDLIGTIANMKTIDRPDIETIILTGDQDCLQLVDYNTKVFSPHKGLSETIIYGEAEVKEKFGGLKPEQLIDYKGLRGDTSDNIPGVKGIGEKGAIDLLNNFKTIEGIYEHIDSDLIKDRTRELLKEQKTQALMSRELATIKKNAPIKFKLADCHFTGFDQNKVVDLFQELGFKRMMSQVATLAKSGMIVPTGQGSLFAATITEQKTSKAAAPPSVIPAHPAYRQAGAGIHVIPASSSVIPAQAGIHVIPASSSVIPAQAGIHVIPANNRLGKQDYKLVTAGELKKFLTELKKQEEFCFDTETTGLDPFTDQLVGIAFCWTKGEAWYLSADLADKIKPELSKIFDSKKIKKIGHNLKFDAEVLNKYFGQAISGLFFDTMIASYVLNPGHRQHNLDTLAFVEFGYQMQPIEELIGKGKIQITMSEVEQEKVSWYAGEDADLTFRLYQKFLPELEKANLSPLFEKLEMPLVGVLVNMETNGIKINSKALKNLSAVFAKRIKEIEKKAWKMAGEEFNLASPKQLKEVLFDKMKISTAGIGKTKTGLSTAAGELEKLQGQHKIIDLIIEFRELSKLKSTYLDALPALADKAGRVHTSYNQTVTATGRLSSSKPNLQNIPIRTE